MSYMPFGEGPRNCIGRRYKIKSKLKRTYFINSFAFRFALMEAKMALVEILRKFSFEASEKTPEPLPVRNKGLTLSVIGDDLWLKMSRRSDL